MSRIIGKREEIIVKGKVEREVKGEVEEREVEREEKGGMEEEEEEVEREVEVGKGS